ncbi:hypothetical protein LAZ29_00910 [Cereibacter sphaeroides]|uniref:glycosyltransferase family 39 protein n=1 Tax=Cereibacter sphaeroides TaxID=1063 RepID=UPI001F32BF6A|nr:hypothetical protein [Cereibacter sphaeroides]MCE6949511.1 hypothetical protein [Cereibacter sphaeroides]
MMISFRRQIKLSDPLALSLLVAVAFLVGVTLRLNHLGSASLWLDETYSAWFSSRDWHYLWHEVPRFETHPSFYYSVLKLWRVFGDDEFTLRLLSTLINLATIPLVARAAFLCGGREMGPFAALASAFLFACSATQLAASQDARPYVFMTFGLVIALLSAIRIMTKEQSASQPIFRLAGHDLAMSGAFAGLGAGIALMAWSHNVGAVFGLWLGISLFVWWFVRGRSKILFLNLLVAAAIAVLVYSPNIPILMMQLEVMGKNGFWLDRPGWMDVYWTLIELPLGFSRYSRRSIAFSGLALLAVIVGAVVLFRATRRAEPRRAVFYLLIVMSAAPAATTFALSWIGQPIFLFRTIQPSQVPLIILMSFMPFIGGSLKSAGVVGLAALATASALPRLSVVTIPGEDWRELVLAIKESRRTENEIPKVMIVPAEAEVPLVYYSKRLDVPMDLQAVPAAYPAIGPDYVYPAGGGGSPRIVADMRTDVEQEISGVDRVWFVTRGREFFDPEKVVESALRRRFPCELQELPRGQLLAAADEYGRCPAVQHAEKP